MPELPLGLKPTACFLTQIQGEKKMEEKEEEENFTEKSSHLVLLG